MSSLRSEIDPTLTPVIGPATYPGQKETTTRLLEEVRDALQDHAGAIPLAKGYLVILEKA